MKLEEVTFSYGDKMVWEHFSLEIPDQGITAIIGPSGCGKTTLLRLLAGLEVPSSGRIAAPSPEKTAFLFQEDRLLPDLNAENQLRAVLHRGASWDEWLRAVGLADERNSCVEELSGGMKRRLALARCLAYGQDKELILLDEPFAGVDEERCFEIMDFIRSLQKTVIMTTHDTQILAKADTVIRLKGIMV